MLRLHRTHPPTHSYSVSLPGTEVLRTVQLDLLAQGRGQQVVVVEVEPGCSAAKVRGWVWVGVRGGTARVGLGWGGVRLGRAEEGREGGKSREGQ